MAELNPLLLQYLTAAGQDIGSGNPIGTNVNAVTNQTVMSKTLFEALSKALEEGGKVTMDKEKFNLTGPSSLLGGTEGMRKSALGQMTGSVPEDRTNPFQIAP